MKSFEPYSALRPRQSVLENRLTGRFFISAFCLLPLAFSLFLVSCGRKANPVPPGTIRPMIIEDLGYAVKKDGIELHWSVPIRNTDGSPLENIQAFQLFKAETPVDEFCEDCPPLFEKPVVIPFDARPEEARKMFYEDRTLKTGMHYLFQVRAIKGRQNVSDPSNRVSLAWHVPPSAPQEFMAITVKDGIRLFWHPPSTWTDGSRLDAGVRYRIYRTVEAQDEWKDISGLVESLDYLDDTVRMDRNYVYRVAAVLPFHGTEIEGPSSPEAVAEPRDLNPPAAPSGLVAVEAKEGIELLWQENTETDLAGYLVYRKGADGLVYLLNKTPIALPRFLDRTVLAPGRYEFWVTAVDRSHPPNESEPSGISVVEIAE